jgi:hypothetical protein
MADDAAGNIEEPRGREEAWTNPSVIIEAAPSRDTHS